MRLMRREPFGGMWNQMHQLQHEMNRVFERWGGDGGWMHALTPSYPAVDIWEDAEAGWVEAELPGLDLKDLEIYVTGGNQLTIKGERKRCVSDKGIWHRQERTFGTFVRVVTLPFEVNREKVEAKLEHGILSVRLPKHEAAKPRKIAVQAE